MAVNEGWTLLIEVATFLFAVRSVGFFCKLVKITPIIGEIIIGMILGPRVLDFVPFTDVDSSSIFSILGTIGVTMIVMESGFHVDFPTVRRLGKKVLGIGVLGTFFPMVLGMVGFKLLGFDWYPVGFTSAIIIAPASVGIALRVLVPLRKLATSYGQMIVTAATEDDLLALILFIILQNISKDDIDIGLVILPIVLAITFIAFVGYLSYHWFPFLLSKLLSCTVTRDLSFFHRDQLHLASLFVVLGILSWIGHLLGSHLLGAFLAGLLYSRVPRTYYLWQTQLKQSVSWLLRLFFSATVAFSIPIDIMFSLEAIWKGLIVMFICVISKLLSTMHLDKKDRWIVGFALVGRGEFSYLIAEFSLQQNIIDKELYSIIVWGLLLSTIISPIMLQYLVKKDGARGDIDPPGTAYELIIEGPRHVGQTQEISSVIDMVFDILSTHITSSRTKEKEIRIIRAKDIEKAVTLDDFHDLEHNIRNVVALHGVQIDVNKIQLPNEGILEFEIMGKDLDKMVEQLNELCKEWNLTTADKEIDTHGHIRSEKITTSGRIVTREELNQYDEVIQTICDRNKIDAQVMVSLSPCVEI